MSNLNPYLILVLFVLLTPTLSTCPSNCANCDTDPAQCDSCNPGYRVNTNTLLCEIDYIDQTGWPGACSSGTRQTPINIDTSSTEVCPPRYEFYQNTKSILTYIKPSGIDLKADYRNLSTVEFTNENGQISTYDSLQFHWHAPSEHTINGKHFDLELHIVHVNNEDAGQLAVTGLFFTVQRNLRTDVLDDYNFFSTHSKREFLFPKILKDRMVFESEQKWELERTKLVYHYLGSLTTPPCGEIVTWFVYAEPITITSRNFDRLKRQINANRSNSRNVQALNGRTVKTIGGLCNPLFRV